MSVKYPHFRPKALSGQFPAMLICSWITVSVIYIHNPFHQTTVQWMVQWLVGPVVERHSTDL